MTAELKLNVPEQLVKEKPFLENTDMLDFPGARSRLELTKEDLSEISVTDMLLRGKIAYLFSIQPILKSITYCFVVTINN